jgi:anti-anti-sigma regulatory factor
MQQYRYFTVDTSQNATVVLLTERQLCGDIVAEVLKLELTSVVDSLAPRALLIDFQNVRMISSSVVTAFISLKKKLVGTGAKLKLCALPVPIREVYQTLNLEGSVFDICDSVLAAQSMNSYETA